MTYDRERDDERVVGAWMDSLPELRDADPNRAVAKLRRHMLDRRVQAARRRLALTGVAVVASAAVAILGAIGLKRASQLNPPGPAVAQAPVTPPPPEPIPDPAPEVVDQPEPEPAPKPRPPVRTPRVRPRPAIAVASVPEPGQEPQTGAKIAGPELASFFTPGFTSAGRSQSPGYVVETARPDPRADTPVEVVRLVDAETREELVRMLVHHADEANAEPQARPGNAAPQPPQTPDPADDPIDSNRSSSTEEGAVA